MSVVQTEFILTIDEGASGSLSLVEALRESSYVISVERELDGVYHVIGVENQIFDITNEYSQCVMKVEPVG